MGNVRRLVIAVVGNPTNEITGPARIDLYEHRLREWFIGKGYFSTNG